MGLLLSILVFSVGVMEAIACIRHIQYGYLPEWAPRRQALVVGTSGLTNLRDRWRKKPSKSVDCDNKTKKRGCDVSRSCDIPCSDNVRQVSSISISGFHSGENLGFSDPVSSDVGEFNLRYQEFAEVLPQEANAFKKRRNSKDDPICFQNPEEMSSQVVNSDSKAGRSQSCCENIVIEEYRSSSRSQSPSPNRPKTDINWPLFTPHLRISRRPSTPTTVEEDISGGQSPYFGGEFLSEEHVKSTERPLSVRTETYHSDQDITPVLFQDSGIIDPVTSLNRPLTIASHTDRLESANGKDYDQQISTTSTNKNELGYANVPSHIPESESSDNGIILEPDPDFQVNNVDFSRDVSKNSVSLPVSEEDHGALSRSEEEKAVEISIKQKRRTSKTEFLPHSEENLRVMTPKELTPEPTFACQKEEPVRLKPVKTTAFEEARLENFKPEPLHAEVSNTSHEGARRSSILSVTEILNIPSEKHEVEIIGTREDSTLTKEAKSEDSNSSTVIPEKTAVKKKKGIKFDDSLDTPVLKSPLVRIIPSVEINGVCDTDPLVEMSAIILVDKIIDEAVAKISNSRTLSIDGRKEFIDKYCITKKNNGEKTVNKGEIENECTPIEENILSKQEEKTIDYNRDSTALSSPEKDQNKPNVDFLASTIVNENNSPKDINNVEGTLSTVVDNTSPKSEHIKKETEDQKHQMNDTKETKFLAEDTLEKTKVCNNDLQEPQENAQSVDPLRATNEVKNSAFTKENAALSQICAERVDNLELSAADDSASESLQEPEKHAQSVDSLRATNEETKNSAFTKENEASSQICAEHIDKLEQSEADNSVSDSLDTRSTSSSEIKESTSSASSLPQSKTTLKTNSGDSTKGDVQQQKQQSSDGTTEAFWLIFSGEYTKAMSKDWHSGHFCCWQCDESLTGQRYVLRDDHPYCIKCYESVFANNCEECNRTIGIDSKDLSYKDKHWHEACFLCTKCRVSLVDKQFGSKADKIYCGNCYDAQFASRCDGCGEIFRAGTKKMEYKTRQWHEKCFCCCVCKTAIGTKSFIPREQEIYCANCYEEKFATRCVKCNKIITSGGVTYKNEPWHRECFTCTNCNTSLAGQRFTSRDEKPYCADCFGELFAKRCTSCSRPITGIGGTRFISFEDRHWHNDCFICASCKTSLVGRGFITDADDIICPDCAKQKLM